MGNSAQVMPDLQRSLRSEAKTAKIAVMLETDMMNLKTNNCEGDMIDIMVNYYKISKREDSTK